MNISHDTWALIRAEVAADRYDKLGTPFYDATLEATVESAKRIKKKIRAAKARIERSEAKLYRMEHGNVSNHP